jgi:hypothetical protein
MIEVRYKLGVFAVVMIFPMHLLRKVRPPSALPSSSLLFLDESRLMAFVNI